MLVLTQRQKGSADISVLRLEEPDDVRALGGDEGP